MGLFKKNDTADGDDNNRSALFGHRSKAKLPTASTNPYAQPQSSNPYAQATNPYAQAPPDPYLAQKEKIYNPPSNPDAKSPAFTSTVAGGGFSNARLGNQAGYGSDNRYGNQGQQGRAVRQGGYGGLGGGENDDDQNRNALFGGAQERMQKQYQAAPPPYDNGGNPDQTGYGGSYGGGAGSYNPGPKYEDRQLTAEEEEEEEINATKQQIKFIKQGDVASTRNALRIAQQAEEVGRDTLARLGVQGEYISNTERNLDLAHNQNKVAEDKAKELKTLNRSMWAVHVSNPFTASSREARRDREVMERHEEERAQREATRRAGYQANERMKKNFQDLSSKNPEKRERNLAERARYQFEADSDDENMEQEIDDNIDQLGAVTSRLNLLAKATGQEIDHQNKVLQRVSEKGDKVDLGIAANKARLDRIR